MFSAFSIHAERDRERGGQKQLLDKNQRQLAEQVVLCGILLNRFYLISRGATTWLTTSRAEKILLCVFPCIERADRDVGPTWAWSVVDDSRPASMVSPSIHRNTNHVVPRHGDTHKRRNNKICN